jgi:Flp pilus assembly protein TadD
MNSRKTKSVRPVLIGIGLVCALAVVSLLIIREYSSAPEPTVTNATGERQGPSGTTEKQTPLPGGTVTNLSAPEADEDRVVALVAEGNQLLERGNYAGAVEKYQQATLLQPDQEDLHYNLGIALAKLGRTEEAKKQYAEALEIFPDYAEARNNLGNLLMKENNLADAITQFREAIRLVPKNASFHNNLGTAFGRQGKVAEAIAEFSEAVKLTPNYVEARVNLGNACLAAGRVEEAIAQLTEATRLQPDFQPALQALQRARRMQDSQGAQK